MRRWKKRSRTARPGSAGSCRCSPICCSGRSSACSAGRIAHSAGAPARARRYWQRAIGQCSLTSTRP